MTSQTGADVLTAAKEQQIHFKCAWMRISQKPEVQKGLLSHKERAKRALKEAGFDWTPEQALHMLGINKAPKPLVAPVTSRF